MKATIKGIEIEGTPSEIAMLIASKSTSKPKRIGFDISINPEYLAKFRADIEELPTADYGRDYASLEKKLGLSSFSGRMLSVAARTGTSCSKTCEAIARYYGAPKPLLIKKA